MPPLFSFIMLLIITISVASFFFPQIIPNFAAMKEKIKRIKQQKLEEKLRLEEQKSAILQEELNRKKLEKELKELESNIPKKKGCLAIIWDLIFGVLAAIAVIVTIIIILDYFKMI